MFGLLDLSAKTGRMADTSSELTLIIIRCCFFLLNYKLLHHDISVGRLTREGLLRKVKTFLEPFATCLQATPGICSRSPNDWTGTLETQSASKTATSGKESCLTCHLRNSSAYAYHCSIHHRWFCRCQNGHQTLILSDECVHDGTHLGASKSNSQKLDSSTDLNLSNSLQAGTMDLL